MMRLALVLLAALAGCGEIGPTGVWDPDFRPDRAVEYEPLALYRQWWSEVADCVRPDLPSGTPLFDNVRWFRVPGESFWTPDHGLASGRWVPQHDIYIADRWIDVGSVVRHEMVHEMLRGGRPNDPRFLECSGSAHE